MNAPRYVVYLRVSTDQQRRSGLGLEAQREVVARHVTQTQGKIIAEYLEAESGKRSDRPELARALADCRARGAVLLVAKLDRLARNTRFLLSIVEGAGEGGVVFCDFPLIPSGPGGKFHLTMMAAVAELEAGLIAQRTRDALRAARAAGTVLGDPLMVAIRAARLQDWEKVRAALSRVVDRPEVPLERRAAVLHLLAEAHAQLGDERTAVELRARGAKPAAVEALAGRAQAAAVRAAGARRVRSTSKARDLAPFLHHARADGARSLRAVAAHLTARGVPTPSGATVWTAEQVRRLIRRVDSSGVTTSGPRQRARSALVDGDAR